MNKENKLQYLSVFKGFSIAFVIIGHAMLLQLPNLHEKWEITLYAILAKIFIPCVFGFFYLSGFSQGLSRKRTNKKKSKKRVKKLFFAYAFWATVCWACFQLLGDDYNQVNNIREMTNSMPLLFNYTFFVFSFSGSWQYYFIWIFLFYTYMLHHFKDFTLKQLKKVLIIVSSIEIGIVLFITLYLWIAEPSDTALKWLSILAYGNPLTWAIPYFGGYFNGAKKNEKIISDKKPVFALALVAIFMISILEFLYLTDKWQAFYVIDHFTFFSLLNSILMLTVYDFIARNIQKFTETSASGNNVLSTFGVYSLIPFFIHMPFQWFLFQLTEKITQTSFNPLLATLIISLYGLVLSYLSIILINKLPNKYKKFLMGI
jgi:hypothetical protein